MFQFLTQYVPAALLSLVAGVMTVLVLSRSFKMPLLMEFGMGLLVLGLVSAVDALVSRAECTDDAVAARWLLATSGVALMLASLGLKSRKRRAHPANRADDLPTENYVNVRGRGCDEGQ